MCPSSLKTKVMGSGGGSTWDGYGHSKPVEIYSATTVHKDLYLLNDNGQEKHFALTDWNIAARTGHILQVIWVIAQDKEVGSYVAVLTYVAGSFWLFILGGIGTWIYWSRQKQALVAELKQAVMGVFIWRRAIKLC